MKYCSKYTTIYNIVEKIYNLNAWLTKSERSYRKEKKSKKKNSGIPTSCPILRLL